MSKIFCGYVKRIALIRNNMSLEICGEQRNDSSLETWAQTNMVQETFGFFVISFFVFLFTFKFDRVFH